MLNIESVKFKFQSVENLSSVKMIKASDSHVLKRRSRIEIKPNRVIFIHVHIRLNIVFFCVIITFCAVALRYDRKVIINIHSELGCFGLRSYRKK